MDLRFGTDGVRARAGTELDEAAVRALGLASAGLLGSDRVAIGRDTRESGPGLVHALAEGFSEGGLEVVSLGMVPTPAVACTASIDGIAGAMVSASHNPWWDNGVKLFSAGGHKLGDETQAVIQGLWQQRPTHGPTGGGAGPEVTDDRWADAVAASVEPGALDGMRLVVDCANGAMSHTAPEVLRRLGADVATINDAPDGRNINNGCGSTHPGGLQAAVVAAGADAGLAFDGDGDRVVAVAADGSLLDGDHLLAVCAVDRNGRGVLPDSTVVVTVMANLGLRRGMGERGITLFETGVGDRYVLEALEAGGWALGGEQSGHLIFRDLATTGDGLLTGVQALDAARRLGRPLGDLAAELVRQVPQVLESVSVVRSGALIVDEIADDVLAASTGLGVEGRVLVRASGTEPVVRVMVEALDPAVARRVAEGLCEAVRSRDAGGAAGS